MSRGNRLRRRPGAARWRRAVAFTAAAVAALALCAAALAKGDPWRASYKGGPGAGGVVKFGTATLKGNHVLQGLTLKRIPVSCSGSAGPAHDSSNGTVDVQIKLDGKAFHYQATASNAQLDSTLTFDGKLAHGRRSASGTLRINGKLVPVNHSQKTARPCDSGVLHWTAARK